MPDMTGLQLLSELKRRGLIIPALLITGANNAELEREAGQLGAMTVMQKPVSPLAVLQFVAFSVGLPSAQDVGL
jgi:CheY-like chemotaxis protein